MAMRDAPPSRRLPGFAAARAAPARRPAHRDDPHRCALCRPFAADPLALAALFGFLLDPLASRLHRWGCLA
jgi:hypothetical protein